MNISKEVKLVNTNRQAVTPMDSSRKILVSSEACSTCSPLSRSRSAFSTVSVLNDPNYIVGSGTDTAVIIGGILEIIVALAGIGTAVALYPVLKRQNEGVALGFVGVSGSGSQHDLR